MTFKSHFVYFFCSSSSGCRFLSSYTVLLNYSSTFWDAPGSSYFRERTAQTAYFDQYCNVFSTMHLVTLHLGTGREAFLFHIHINYWYDTLNSYKKPASFILLQFMDNIGFMAATSLPLPHHPTPITFVLYSESSVNERLNYCQTLCQPWTLQGRQGKSGIRDARTKSRITQWIYIYSALHFPQF